MTTSAKHVKVPTNSTAANKNDEKWQNFGGGGGVPRKIL